MATSFTPIIPCSVRRRDTRKWSDDYITRTSGLPNRMVLSVGEMPSLSTGYRLVTRMLHMHIFLVMMTKQPV